MSATLTLAKKDAAVVLAEALAIYKGQAGRVLAPGDPIRHVLQTIVLCLAQQRALIDFAGKQSLLRFVSAEFIEALAELWEGALLPALPSETTMRYTATTPGVITVASGKRVTDGVHVWAVESTAVSESGAAYLDVVVKCTITGSSTNGVAIGQIDTMVDDVPGIASVTNLSETISGRNIEATEAFRERLRDAPENTSPAGPRVAYRAMALKASSNVADAVALGPDDGPYMTGTTPADGEVHLVVIMGERDAEGVLTSVVPTPTAGLLSAVDEYCSDETRRPLGDRLITKAASFQDYDVVATYWIARSRIEQASEIQAAVEEAFEAYKLWQDSAIGRDINPDELRARLRNAGAKRIDTDLTFQPLNRDQCARNAYDALVFEGVEDD